jgi:DNA-binding response OmpR family regulator
MSKHILLAEDDPGISEVVKIILSDEGYTIHTAITKKSIEETLALQTVVLILLDVSLSGESGIDIGRALKKDAHTKAIPLVMLSANTNIEEISEDIGADAFLKKPFEIEELLSMAKKYT